MNLFTPSMKLQKKIRIGSKMKKIYDQPKTPLDRLIDSGKGKQAEISKLLSLRKNLDPFELSKNIEIQIENIFSLRSNFQHRKGMFTPLQITNIIQPMHHRIRIARLKDEIHRK